MKLLKLNCLKGCVIMARVIADCPNCPGRLVIDTAKADFTCTFCKLTFNINQANFNYSTPNNSSPDFVIYNGVLEKYYGSSLSVYIPDNVIKIGDNAFRKNSYLEYIDIPDSVTEIGDNAFENCSSLQSAYIPDSVTRIGEGAFWGCSNLQAIKISDSIDEIGAFTFAGCSSLRNIAIPNGVQEIGNHAFLKCSALNLIMLPAGITKIGDGAFRECSSLTSLTIPNSVTGIGSSAFDKCPDTFVFDGNNLGRFDVTLINDRKRRGKCLSCGGNIAVFGRRCLKCGRRN